MALFQKIVFQAVRTRHHSSFSVQVTDSANINLSLVKGTISGSGFLAVGVRHHSSYGVNLTDSAK